MSSLLTIPTEYDADVRVHVSTNTMLFTGGMVLLFLLAKKRKII
jgi:hypothetical protein